MKKLLAFVVIIALSWLLTYFGPWYLIALAGIAGGVIIRHNWWGFLIGFLAGFALWFIQIWFLKNGSPSDLPDRMGQLIGVGNGMMLTLLTAAIGGLVTGSASAATGTFLMEEKQKKRSKRRGGKRRKHKRRSSHRSNRRKYS